ncbi:MAG: response regulator [Desulfobacterales bacterium]|nr:response regulator [Desulfobacterales bacterium]
MASILEIQIKYKILIFMILVVAITSIPFSVIYFKSQKEALLAKIDAKLISAAKSAKYILPENYHDRIVDRNSISKEDYLRIIDQYNKLCTELGLEYLWSLMIIDDQTVFTSSTSTDKKVENGKHALFFDVHSNPGAYKEAFETMEIDRRINDDKWGRIRAVLVPAFDKKGRRHLFGASMKVRDIDSLVTKTVENVIMIATAVFFLGGCLSLVLANMLSRPISKLTNVAEKIAGGELNENIDVRGSFELGSLSKSLNYMRESISDTISELHLRNDELEIEIRDREQVEKALRISHERFLTVLDGIDATVYVSDMETYEILFMNKCMKASFGRDMTGEKCWNAFRGKSEPCPFCTNDKLIDKNGKPADVCVWQDRNPITNKWYVNHDRAIEWTDGCLVRLQIATDISELKKMEEELRQAYKMESIGTLAGGIAHDFNNILFPILGNAELLIEDIPEDNPQRNNLNAIFEGALRAKDLVKQILAFSRQDSLEVKLMKMQPIIKEALSLIRSTIPTSIEIKQDIKKDCGAIIADPSQIHQVVMNLATNAYHAMEETGGELRIDLKEIQLGKQDLPGQAMVPGSYACLKVTDTGTGIDEVIKEKIFDPYFTTKAQGKGTGMGLAVIQGIVQNAGGHVQVYSEPDQGTEFHVYLPVAHNAFKEQDTPTEKPIKRGTEQILLVDDEEAIILIEKQMLERLGYSVVSRTSSVEALEAFRANPEKFDLVITDLAMPNISGDKLASELKEIHTDIPILLCTGFSEKIPAEKTKSMGIEGFLMKPIVMKDLSNKIREVLDNKESSN